MNHVILVKRSSGGSYHVEFIKDKGRLRVRCNCTLGSIGQICRHKRALIQGSTKVLYQSGQEKLLREILAWPEMRVLAARAKEYESEIAEIESQITVLSKEVQLIKNRFASDCLDGVHDV
ncbi:MAG: hypothetical protein WCD79_05265 [Chthoniobacteraceae bacterium]